MLYIQRNYSNIKILYFIIIAEVDDNKQLLETRLHSSVVNELNEVLEPCDNNDDDGRFSFRNTLLKKYHH